MAAIRPSGMREGTFREDMMYPGDLPLFGESVANNLTTAGAGVWTAGIITTGIIRRTGPGAGYADTSDTALAILSALAGNSPSGLIVPGNTFRMRFINTVAFAMTFTRGAGVLAGLGTLDCAASLWREYLWTITNTTPQYILSCATTNGSPTVTFNLPPGRSSYPQGSDPASVNITPGATVTGTGIPADTTVLGVTQGLGGITGITLSANATATNNPVALTFGPTMKIDALGGGNL